MKTLRRKILVAILALALSAANALAGEIQFESLKVFEDKYRVSFSVTSYQRREIIDAIKRGMEVRIIYDLQIFRAPGMFFLGNRVVYDRTILRSVKFDFWSKSYQVKEGQKKTAFQSENSMLDYFFSVRDYELGGAAATAIGGSYSLRVRAELKTVDLYFPMNLIFKYLVGFWDFNTGWRNVPLTKAP